jgi:hypothetical protein
LHIRDIKINDFRDWACSDVLKSITPAGSAPTLDHSYTVTTDTLAAVDLERYLDSVGLAQRVSFEVTGDSSMNGLENSNIIALGARSTLQPFRDYLASMNFSIGPMEAWVQNSHPQPGELLRYAVSE